MPRQKSSVKNKKNCSKIIKECVKVIKTNNILSDQFTVYDNLKNSTIEEKYTTQYINENIDSLKRQHYTKYHKG